MPEPPSEFNSNITDSGDESTNWELLGMLQRATADPATPLETDVEELKALREGWLAMDQLLRTAVDEVPAFGASTARTEAVSSNARSYRHPGKSRWSLAVISGTITCLTAVLFWLMINLRESDPPDQLAEPQRIAAANNSASKDETLVAPFVDPLPWSDSLDDEIQLMQERIRLLSRSADGEANYRSLSRQFELLREDFFDTDAL